MLAWLAVSKSHTPNSPVPRNASGPNGGAIPPACSGSTVSHLLIGAKQLEDGLGSCLMPSFDDLPDSPPAGQRVRSPYLLRVPGALSIRDCRVRCFVALVHGYRLIYLSLVLVLCHRLLELACFRLGIGICSGPTLPSERDHSPTPSSWSRRPSVWDGTGLTFHLHWLGCHRLCRLLHGCCGISALCQRLWASLERDVQLSVAVSKLVAH